MKASRRIPPTQRFAHASAIAFVLFLVATAVHAAERRTDKSRLAVVTLNTGFRFDGGLPDGQANIYWKGSLSEAEEHMETLATEILQIDADVVNLCEVENLSILEAMNTKSLAGGGYKEYLVDGKDTFTGRDVGILTKVDPDDPLSRDERIGQRGCATC